MPLAKELNQETLLRILGLVTAAVLQEYDSLEEMLQALVPILHEQSGYNHLTVGLVNPAGQVIFRAGYGIPQAVRKRLTVNPGQGIVGWVFEHGEPLLVPDVRTEPRYRKVLEATRSELCVPLKTHRGVFGIINAESKRVGRFTTQDLNLMTMLAEIVSGPLERMLKQELVEQEQTQSVLTTRECQVLQRVAEGRSNKWIARDLHIREHTVEAHLRNIYNKLDVSSRTEAVLKAHRLGLLQTPS